MRLRILSDLHHEHYNGRRPLPKVDTDVVVLAGDIHTQLEGLHWARDEFADTPIIYVAGNHEFYDGDLPELTQAMRETAQALGIHFLENDALVLGEVRFLGATLWTDFGLYGEEGIEPALSKALRLMPDFHCVTYGDEPYSPALSQQLFKASKEWLARQLTAPFTGPTVVITHHAPSTRSIPEQFEGDALSPAFASNLEALVAQADLWIHGHVHERMDYRIGRCRVVANPGAYPGEDSGFDASWVIDV
ncbi:metallophosphoesterase [Pseudomonas sp. R5(2019)]|uniref:metallophosphoesterase n=1 Tax=Pseudomonas sp. R5(2019) TaxID=2697566 RepID=UPI001412F173|nr:metallophosphoesterase [Pseudomonas sp. R5(2019)]NBA97707.1 metallo-dependent phosphatase [Pseudomonas sp. R5(2019)]